MNLRRLSVLAAFAALTPLAAYADAPSGDFAEIFGPQPPVQAEPQFPRAEHRNYVEGNFDQWVARKSNVTVEQVRAAIAAGPLPIVGA